MIKNYLRAYPFSEAMPFKCVKYFLNHPADGDYMNLKNLNFQFH